MHLNDTELLDKVNAYALKNSTKSMFVVSAIEFAALCKKNKEPLDVYKIWQEMYTHQEQAVRIFIDDKIQKEPEFAKFCNKLITQKDIEWLPRVIVSLLPSNMLELKYKELEATLTVYDRLCNVHETLTPTQIITKVLTEFEGEIEELSKIIELKLYAA